MTPSERSERIALRLTAEEAEVVQQVADETGLSLSDVVRQAIRAAHAERFKVLAKKRKR